MHQGALAPFWPAAAQAVSESQSTPRIFCSAYVAVTHVHMQLQLVVPFQPLKTARAGSPFYILHAVLRALLHHLPTMIIARLQTKTPF